MCCTIMCFKHVMLKRDSGRCFTYKWNPKIEFLHEFSENFKPNWQGMVHANIISHVNVHPCAKFYVIRTMLGESMVHKVAIWDWQTCMIIDSHRRSTLRVAGLVEKDCFFMFIIFNGRYLTQRCHKWRFKKILSNFEWWVMIFGSFGQTMVDQSFCE